MLKQLALLIGVVLFAASAVAADDYDEASYSRSNSAVLVNASFTKGGFGLGADYEYAYHSTYGIGGYTRFYQKDEDEGANGLFSFGAFVRPHFHRRSWNLYVAPGFGVTMVDPAAKNADSETVFGPAIMYGLLFKFSKQMAFGVENMKIYSWFGDDFKGHLLDDLAAKFRFEF